MSTLMQMVVGVGSPMEATKVVANGGDLRIQMFLTSFGTTQIRTSLMPCW